MTDGALRREAQAPARHSPRPDWQLRLSALRRTAGCRPSATPAQPASGRPPPRCRARPQEPPSSRRSRLEPGKITVKSARCARVLRMALGATPDGDLARFTLAPIRRMARTGPRPPPGNAPNYRAAQQETYRNHSPDRWSLPEPEPSPTCAATEED